MLVLSVGQAFHFDMSRWKSALRLGRWELGAFLDRAGYGHARCWGWQRDAFGRLELDMGPLHLDWGRLPMLAAPSWPDAPPVAGTLAEPAMVPVAAPEGTL